ncbi:MarR family winged helix-turn-helix transcriptional regulator [Marinobacterium lutimaris]|uniref:DNA-binding transcriptional regulator, MarR family n=1 Tax=Marinobacterium lutimaris TaxID=568106 RepID=A0A1H6D946_9GAMM|nr:MarR family transcriptional regulator [Marinobacterium lutimaris]SEG81654.1 DNA-binding transcriptional regulator, MarR family [Marinobacterium lutimaris]
MRRYNPTSDDFKKEEFPLYWLARVHGRYTLAMEKTLKKIGMDIPRYRILFILKEQGISSISEIAEHAVAKLPTITKTIYRMKDDGLVDTAPSPDDGRVTQVTLTAKGQEAIISIEEATTKLFNQSFKGMTEAQLKRLNRMLETIFNNLPEH